MLLIGTEGFNLIYALYLYIFLPDLDVWHFVLENFVVASF